MSDVISAWVDSDEMRRLAETLLARPTEQERKRLEIDYGSQFEGYAPEVVFSQVSNFAPKKVVEPSEAPPPPPKGSPTSPPKTPPTTAFSARPTLSASAEPLPKLAPLIQSKEREDPIVPSPGVMKSAVHFLKKAQVEGMAGGIIRSGAPPKGDEVPPSGSLPPSLPKPEAGTSTAPEPAASESKSTPFSPFRRVSGSERSVVAPSQLSRNLVRPPTPSGDDPILARVRHFGSWLKGPVGARNFFISNLEGKILIDEVGNPKLIQVARSLVGASKASGEETSGVASLHVRIGEDAILEVIPTPSQFGTLILGLIVSQSLAEESIREVRAGLQETADARLIQIQSRRS